MVANLSYFYEAFDVPAGSPLHLAPDQRVHMW
jgi:predicted metalloendopeptidase